jgi:hypothetical protein
VVIVPGYRSRGSGSILGSIRFSEKQRVGLERGPFSLVSTIEELLRRKSNGSGLEIREYCRRDSSRWARGTLYPQKLALPSPKNGGRSNGIVRFRTQAKEFSFKQCCQPCVQPLNLEEQFPVFMSCRYPGFFSTPVTTCRVAVMALLASTQGQII